MNKCTVVGHQFIHGEAELKVTSTMFNTSGKKWRWCYRCRKDIECS